MDLQPYTIKSTNELITSRGGLLVLAGLISKLGLSDVINSNLPRPGSNRGFSPSDFVLSLIFMLHEGGGCLDDLWEIYQDKVMKRLTKINFTTPSAMSKWLKRQSNKKILGLIEVNRFLLMAGLNQVKSVTLDIDASLFLSSKKLSKYTYLGHKGFSPMFGHIAETGMIVAAEFRHGNVSPNTRNFEFIQYCEQALPKGVSLGAVRIDAAGYQHRIIDDCMEREINFAIRAKMSDSLRKEIFLIEDQQWEPFINRQGETEKKQQTAKILHSMIDSKHAFEVIIQRTLIDEGDQIELDLSSTEDCAHRGKYVYRAIAVRHCGLSNSEVIHWYNQRAEHSENRIKELKRDFAATNLPSGDFDANALYLNTCAIAFNLFSLLKMLLPAEFDSSRLKRIQLRIYSTAAKLTQHARRLFFSFQQRNAKLLSRALSLIRNAYIRLA